VTNAANRSLHVGGAAAVEIAIALGGDERIAGPLIERTGRQHVGVAREANQRAAAAANAQRLSTFAEAHALDGEAAALQARRQDILAAVVVRA
jgi:hypothetical protein